ncbi:MAG: hypothetical protein IKU07_09260 [Oscillospiraceae bacterium]|nr:hypothetical protein [Oscillospiraceae bacterium]
MTDFTKKETVCFVGRFDADYLNDAISQENYECIFLDHTRLTDTLPYWYDYTFVKENESRPILFYASDIHYVSFIETGAASAESCAAAILHFNEGWLGGVEMRDLIHSLQYADISYFLHSVSVEEAKNHIAEIKSLTEVVGTVYSPSFDLAALENVCQELSLASKSEIGFMVNQTVIPKLTGHICDIFLCQKADVACSQSSENQNSVLTFKGDCRMQDLPFIIPKRFCGSTAMPKHSKELEMSLRNFITSTDDNYYDDELDKGILSMYFRLDNEICVEQKVYIQQSDYVCYTTFSIHTTIENQKLLLHYITIANSINAELDYGNFEVDVRTGDIRFRTYYEPIDIVRMEAFDKLLGYPRHIINKYGQLFIAEL